MGKRQLKKQVTKRQLVEVISERWKITKVEAEKKLDDLLSILQQGLADVGRINLPPLGTFEVRRCKARSIVKPGSSDRMRLPAMRKVLFRQAAALRERLNAVPAPAPAPAPEES